MMDIRVFIVLQISMISTNAMNYEKPAAANVWKERCNKNTHVLNDCNWCRCDRGRSFKCEARVCGLVDMFGHFNDAIMDINVGMEGRGVWRTTPSACAPGVYYRRESVLCVCNEDGFWPNPVCRDTFRVLHSVEVTRGIEMSQKCMPTKLYLVGCNVCFCPSSARLNPEFCTKMSCVDGDPVLNATQTKLETEPEAADLEVYATCDVKKKYIMGCQTCSCLRNNRLLCGNCTADKKSNEEQDQSICSDYEVEEVFNVGCNYCFCDENSFLYCTTKNCLRINSVDRIDMLNPFEYSETPVADHECKPGTRYIKDCNVCQCSIQNGVKAYTCTLKPCPTKATRAIVDSLQNDCVNGTAYEKNCLICRCDETNVKRETCIVDKGCSRADNDHMELSHGFCQPLRIYNKDCNICQCLASGQITKCTTRSCKKPDPITVDLVPFRAKHPEPCPKGMSYKLDCNICFCLENGNAICTSNDCSKHRDGW